MRYELIKKDFKNKAVLIKADDVELWIDYQFNDDDIEWDFNMYIFNNSKKHDRKIKETQEKIYDDIENFSFFMDSIFSDIKKGGDNID